MSYEQARADHEYLWSIGPAYDMTGGYVDQKDLHTLLTRPTKATARSCYIRQIDYWFQVGPDVSDLGSNCRKGLEKLLRDDPKVREIQERWGIRHE